MKQKILLSLLFLCTLFALPSPAAAAPEEPTYNISFEERSFEQVLSDLRRKTGYEFVYQKQIIESIAPITCSYRNVTLRQILDRIVWNLAGLKYEIVEKTVILSRPDEELGYFKKLVTGIVTDSDGNPLVGASVAQEGTTTGTVTDIDGQFTLLVEGKDPRIVISYVGMQTQTLRLNPEHEGFLAATLETGTTLMDEVVVTGYQNLKRENATGSYQVISSAEIDSRYTGDVVSRLEGMVPGLVSYDNGSGKSGEQAITIRGVGSFQARTNPLVVVDGLPIEGSIESVNPYDIENITILKDASAAAIYGARASNGVIVIKTKRAQSEQLAIDFRADLTISERQSYDNYRWASAAEMIELEKYNFDFVCANDQWQELVDTYNTDRYSLSRVSRLLTANRMGLLSDEELNRTLDSWRRNNYREEWRDARLRPQILQQYNLSFRTMGRYLSSSIVLNYKGDNNGVKYEHQRNLMLSYRGDLKATRWLNLAFGINVLNERAQTHADIEGFSSINAFQPYESMYNADGSRADMEAAVWLDEETLKNPDLKSERYNLLDELNRNFNRSRRTNIRSFAHADVQILPELHATAQFQYEDIYYKSEAMFESDSYDMRHLYNLFTYEGDHSLFPEGGMLGTNLEEGAYYTFRTQANYNKTFGGKHALDLLGGFEFRETKTRANSSLLLGYDDATQTNMNSNIDFYALRNATASDLGDNDSPMGTGDMLLYNFPFATSEVLHRYYSLYFNGGYTYDSRYSAQLSVRLDKTDLFGADPEFRGRPLWSAGLSWNLHNEKFMEGTAGWLDALKLRASYGLTGNIDQSVSSYLTAAIATNDFGVKQATLNTPPNEQLRWEKTTTWNVGIDFSLLNNRLSGSVDWYRKWGSDLLTETDIDPTTGFSQLTINNGEALNTGVEIQLDARIIRPARRGGFGLDASLSFAYNHNEVKSISHLPASGDEALGTMHVGYPINSIWAYRFAGVQDVDGTPTFSWKDAEGTVQTDPVTSSSFTPEDIVYCGSLDPKYTGSFSPVLTWKGFTLSALFSFYGGHHMRVRAEEWTTAGSVGGYDSHLIDSTVPSSYLDYWRAEDKTGLVPNGMAGAYAASDWRLDANVVPADYLKVRNIVLDYDFPSRICRKIGVAGLRLRVQMNNLATWVRNEQGIDPEANSPLSGETLDLTPRSYTMSVGITF